MPIVVSVPHCGIEFPDEIKDEYKLHLRQNPDDTDWFVDQLYNFAPAMGMTMISARYSRWVIDVNRDREGKALYNDGRIITALCPTTNFLGEPIYVDERHEVAPVEVNRRIENYYQPYHNKVQELLDEAKAIHGVALLWDCHSIRRIVPTIQADAFPDLILGSADERSAAPALIATALNSLRSGEYQVNHNHPFKGGSITRNFGRPSERQHALQLEMCKVHYMDDAEIHYDTHRADKMRTLLKKTFDTLLDKLSALR